MILKKTIYNDDKNYAPKEGEQIFGPNENRSTAESPIVQAQMAREDATEASKRASEAVKTAGEAAEIANAVSQKVWSDDSGLHISDGNQDAAATRNTIWNSLGMLFRKGLNPILGVLTGDNPRVAIYDGQGSGEEHEAASFGTTVRIGGVDAYKTVMNAGQFSILSPEDAELLNFQPSGNPSSEITTKLEKASENATSITLSKTPLSQTEIRVYLSNIDRSHILKRFTAGQSSTITISETISISYNGDKTITIDENDDENLMYIESVFYEYSSPSIDLGALTIGTRVSGTSLGNGSATIGRNLIASYPYQTAVGLNNTGYSDSIFEVGGGSESHPSTYFRVSRSKASISEGTWTNGSGACSHAEGDSTEAKGYTSHAEGYKTIASKAYSHVEGIYNIEDTDTEHLHIIGNGYSDVNRSNAFAVDWYGNVKAKGNVYVNCNADSSGTAHIGQVFNWQGSLKSNLTANAGAYVEGNGSITLKGGHTYLVLAYVAMTNSTNGTVDRRAQIFNKTADAAVLTGSKFVASQVWGTVETQTIYEAGEDVTLTVRGSASRPTTTIPTAWIRAVCIA